MGRREPRFLSRRLLIVPLRGEVWGTVVPQVVSHVASEKARGALLYTLMQYPQLTLFPLNSKATGKLGEALRASGATNDRWDCRPHAELVKHFHHLLPVWRPDDVTESKTTSEKR